MRVISGTWRGRRLKAPVGEAVRPTTDRVKEAMFNILGPAVAGCTFVDLCCGAGGLGIEALSRGADLVYFVDQSRRSLEAVRANLAVCGAEDGRYRLAMGSAETWLADPVEISAGSTLIVVADPPYQSPAAGAIMGLMETLSREGGIHCGIVEYGPRTPGVPGEPDSSSVWDVRRYGESRLAVIRSGTAGESEGEET